MKKKKDLDLAPSRRERKTLGQYILLFFLVLYTLFCALPIVLVFVRTEWFLVYSEEGVT